MQTIVLINGTQINTEQDILSMVNRLQVLTVNSVEDVDYRIAVDKILYIAKEKPIVPPVEEPIEETPIEEPIEPIVGDPVEAPIEEEPIEEPTKEPVEGEPTAPPIEEEEEEVIDGE